MEKGKSLDIRVKDQNPIAGSAIAFVNLELAPFLLFWTPIFPVYMTVELG